MIKLSLYFLTILERIAKRLEAFYSRLSSHSIYTPTLEKNPARTRWNPLRRKIKEESFFILTEDIHFLYLSYFKPKSISIFHTPRSKHQISTCNESNQAVD